MSQTMQLVDAAKKQFIEINEASPETTLVWKSEANFALQAVTRNDYLAKAVGKTPASLRDAIINVASVGLSLNPATAYAYLVPRDGRVCLDISYTGLIKMATDTGSIMWARAAVVYDNDIFEYKGPSEKPVHTANVFAKDRGEPIGVYCIAKTCDGDYLIETMTETEVQEIKSKSPSASSAYSPWNTFADEMRKKSVIKRASKTWPKTDRHERLAKVIEYVNRDEGIDFKEPTEEDKRHFDDLLHEKNGAAICNLMHDDMDYWYKIQTSFAPHGGKVKHKEMIAGWMAEARDYVTGIIEIMAFSDEPDDAKLEAYQELNEHERKLFWDTIEPEPKITVENFLRDIAA